MTIGFNFEPSPQQHDGDSIFFISCGTDFYSFLSGAVDCAVWWHVEREQSFIHVSDEVQWVAVFFTAIDDDEI